MSDPLDWHSRGYLPHFDDGSQTQFVTYRLADSLPSKVMASLEERIEDNRLRFAAIEQYLDASHGSSILQRPDIADVVVAAWQHFDGLRYHLHAWVVMPNHVHVLVQPLGGHSLSSVVHSQKSYTAKAILRRTSNTSCADHAARPAGPMSAVPRRVWQPEYFDRFIRNGEHYAATVAYIHKNPVKAGLVAHAEAWKWSSARWLVAPS